MSKKVLNGWFWALFGANFGQFRQILAIFGQFLGQIELFPKLIGFFLGGRFFMRTVTSDCLADKFGGRLEISTIRHHGWLRGSNRRPLSQAPRVVGLGTSQGTKNFRTPPRLFHVLPIFCNPALVTGILLEPILPLGNIEVNIPPRLLQY